MYIVFCFILVFDHIRMYIGLLSHVACGVAEPLLFKGLDEIIPLKKILERYFSACFYITDAVKTHIHHVELSIA